MLKVIEGLHHWVAKRILGMTTQHTTGGEWEGPLMAEVMDTDGLWKIKEYIQRTQAIVTVQVDFRPIYELYTG